MTRRALPSWQQRSTLRSLLDRIVIHPGPKRGETNIEVVGGAAGIFQLATNPAGNNPDPAGSAGMVVPRGGLQ